MLYYIIIFNLSIWDLGIAFLLTKIHFYNKTIKASSKSSYFNLFYEPYYFTYLITPSGYSDGYGFAKPSKDDKDLHAFNPASN